MTLHPRNQARVQAASRCDVTQTLCGLKPFFEKGRWLGPRNRYAKKTVAALQSYGNGPLIAPKQLSQYIAASIVLHCADGWSFFGSAISALLHGDPHRARHLAYYAELRAAMSILATFGIGVFKNKHFVIDGKDSAAALPVKTGTHEFVWDCIEYLGTQNELGDIFASAVKPYGRKLGDWLAPVGGALSIAPQAREWFLQWGQDLRMPITDRDARNESSYRPDGIPISWYLDPPEVLDFVRDLWHALEPVPNSSFEQIDRHILRVAVDARYHALYGARRPSRRPPLDGFIDKIIDRQAFDPEIAKIWKQYLLMRKGPGDDGTLLVASRRPADSLEGSEFSILARATLLLRAASGSASETFLTAGVNITMIEFWRNGLGLGRGLWQSSEKDPSDLWLDVQPLLSDIQSFRKQRVASEQSFFRIVTELGQAVCGLGIGDRVAVWSMSS